MLRASSRRLGRCLDSEPEVAGNDWNCFSLARGKIVARQFTPSSRRKLLAVFPDSALISSPSALEFTVKIGQLIDGIGSADLRLLLRAQPWKPLFEQLEHRLDKSLRQAILFGHKITSIVVVNEWLIRNPA